MARRTTELCWAVCITLLATCCTAIRRAYELDDADDPKPVEVSSDWSSASMLRIRSQAATAELHSITWALYLLGYFLIVSSFGDAWTYVRERVSCLPSVQVG